jgi:hypothetical protein
MGHISQGGWVPIDKALVSALPHDRPFTELEAMFSLAVNHDNGRRFSVSGTANLWGWSRKKVRCFLDKIGVEMAPENNVSARDPRGQVGLQARDKQGNKLGTSKGQVNFIFSGQLDAGRDKLGTSKGQVGLQARDKQGNTNIDPDPKPLNPEPKNKSSSSTAAAAKLPQGPVIEAGQDDEDDGSISFPELENLFAETFGVRPPPALRQSLERDRKAHPAERILEAFRSAAEHGARSYAYVTRTLENSNTPRYVSFLEKYDIAHNELPDLGANDQKYKPATREEVNQRRARDGLDPI